MGQGNEMYDYFTGRLSTLFFTTQGWKLSVWPRTLGLTDEPTSSSRVSRDGTVRPCHTSVLTLTPGATAVVVLILDDKDLIETIIAAYFRR